MFNFFFALLAIIRKILNVSVFLLCLNRGLFDHEGEDGGDAEEEEEELEEEEEGGGGGKVNEEETTPKSSARKEKEVTKEDSGKQKIRLKAKKVVQTVFNYNKEEKKGQKKTTDEAEVLYERNMEAIREMKQVAKNEFFIYDESSVGTREK